MDVLYLHGFGDCDPVSGNVGAALINGLPEARVHAPCYHPNGRIVETQIGTTLESCQRLILNSRTDSVSLVGYSFGGLIAAILATQVPDRIGKVLLLAPAIDNFDRNYHGISPERWAMPAEFVAELQEYPQRPAIVRPTVLVHGMLDNDRGGSDPWRIKQWAARESFESVYLIDRVNHSMRPWIDGTECTIDDGKAMPTFQELVGDYLLNAD